MRLERIKYINKKNINMKQLKIKIVFFILLVAATKVYAQQSCYQIGLNEGREIYNEAQRLERNGRCVEAVPKFWEALSRFRLTRSCRDLPANHELVSWEDRCIQGVAACGGKNDETTFLNVSPRSLAFTEAGGDNFITVNTNTNSWRVDRSPSWCAVQRRNNGLTVTCQENTGTNGRSDKLIIVANTLTYEVTIEQAGKATPETPPFASLKITGVRFAGKYADGTSKGYGEELYNNMTFIVPRIACDHLAMESKPVRLDFKILAPNGRLLSESNSGYTYSADVTLRGNLQQNDVFDVSEWGAQTGTAFAATGRYTFEIWCSGVNMFSTAFEVFPKAVPPCESVKITGVQFKAQYSGGVFGEYGKTMYNNMTFITPRITCDNLTEDGKRVRLDFKILDPDGNLLGSASGYTWNTEITAPGNMRQGYVFDVSEWGAANGAMFSKTGVYRFEIWCSNGSLFATSFEVARVEPAAPAPVVQQVSAAKLKTGIGIKAGLNMTTIGNEMSDINFSPELKHDFHAGIFFNMNFGYRENKPGFFVLQPELLYSRQGFLLNDDRVNFDYITLPLMIKLYLYQGFSFEFGPWISYLLAVNPNSTTISGSNIKLSDLKGGKDAGIAAGIGYDFDFGLTIGARYRHGLSDMASNLLWTNRVISISLGWKF